MLPLPTIDPVMTRQPLGIPRQGPPRRDSINSSIRPGWRGGGFFHSDKMRVVEKLTRQGNEDIATQIRH